MTDLLSGMIAWEDGELTDDEEDVLFQDLVTSGMAWRLQGMYGRRAEALIEEGRVTAP